MLKDISDEQIDSATLPGTFANIDSISYWQLDQKAVPSFDSGAFCGSRRRERRIIKIRVMKLSKYSNEIVLLNNEDCYGKS